MTRLLAWWDALRGSLWFTPGLGIVLGFVLSMAMLWVDRSFLDGTIDSQWLRTTPSASRAILSALTGALITVTGLVFSITMLTLAQTASMYGGRLLRTFMSRPLPQITLATFLGTAVFCLRVLRDVRDVDEVQFAPHASTAVAIGLFFVCIGLLIAFIHHTASMLQAPEILRSVYEDLNDAIKRIYPAGVGDPSGEAPPDDRLATIPSTAVSLREVGYLQGIDEELVLELASRINGVIRLRVRPGLFVGSQTTVAEIVPREAADRDVREQLREAFIIGSDRTPRQDVEAAILELVEVAVRALSPGINDPRTAITATHYLSDAFVQLAGRQFPSEARFDDGELRLLMPRERFDAMLSTAFAAILHYAGDFGPNIEAILEGCQRIAQAIERAADPARDDDLESIRDTPPDDLDAKRRAVADVVGLIGLHVEATLRDPQRDLLLDQCRQLQEALRQGNAATAIGLRDSDAMTTAVEAISGQA